MNAKAIEVQMWSLQNGRSIWALTTSDIFRVTVDDSGIFRLDDGTPLLLTYNDNNKYILKFRSICFNDVSFFHSYESAVLAGMARALRHAADATEEEDVTAIGRARTDYLRFNSMRSIREHFIMEENADE